MYFCVETTSVLFKFVMNMSLWLFYRSLRDKVNLEATMALRSDFASVANSSDGNNAELIFFFLFSLLIQNKKWQRMSDK